MAAPSSKAASSAATELSTSGRVFFGSLCVGTFGLGVWQTQRLTEKQSLMEERTRELNLEPTTNLGPTTEPYRRRLVKGTFRYDKEVLIGPRGAPVGVSLPRQGLSARSKGGGGSAAMGPGPQGYHILTPLELSSVYVDAQERKVVWVNRGWIPMTLLPGINRRNVEPMDTSGMWARPKGEVALSAIQSSPERPRIITPNHDLSKRPLQLFWFDGSMLQSIAESEEDTLILTQVRDDNDEKSSDDTESLYPLVPPVGSMGEFKVTPVIHAGYAATWFGLSGAGMYMMRKLMTRGRG